MAERSRSREVTMVSPLYCAGVHHATVHSPIPGSPPDPMGYLTAGSNDAGWMTEGRGDDVNDWHEEFPNQKNIQGQ
jgi:hypothetical protein